MTEFSEDILIDKLREGDHKAFEWIFREYYVMLCYEAKGYIAENQIVEEIVGDVFRWIWENRKKLVISVSLRAYLIRAVHNACLRHLRQSIPQRVELNEVSERHTLFSVGESPLDYVLSREMTQRILKAVEDLPPQYKKVFKYSRYREKSYYEIAEEMNISVNTVKLYLKKALARLRKELIE